MSRLYLLALVLSVGCIDYRFWRAGDASEGREWTDDDEVVFILESCDPYEGTDSIGIDEVCEYGGALQPLEVEVEWQVETFVQYWESSDVFVPPLVGRLTDTNGDGTVDAEDTPNIVVVSDSSSSNEDKGSISHGVFRVLDGSTGQDIFAVNGVVSGEVQLYPYRYGGLAMGDIDLDGDVEIVTVVELISDTDAPPDTSAPSEDPDSAVPIFPKTSFNTEGDEREPCAVAAWEADGSLAWFSKEAGMQCGSHAPALADLTGDGTVEVVIGSIVLEGATGETIWEAEDGEGNSSELSEMGSHSYPVDLDGDGEMEILAGRTVYSADGTVRCTIDASFGDGFPGAADFDLDGDGEFVVVGYAEAKVFEDDCTLRASWDLDGDWGGGPPTIADVDLDGYPEIGVASDVAYAFYEADGEMLWVNEILDESSHVSTGIVVDLEGKGRPTVLYADESTLWAFDGLTGEVRLQDELHESRTLHEYPVVADVDGDGEVEIIVPNAGGHYDEQLSGLYVLGNAGSTPWTSGPAVWNQHAYKATQVNESVEIHTGSVLGWSDENSLRSGPIQSFDGGALGDAQVWGGVCLRCIGRDAQIGFQIGNSGMDVLSSVWVSAYVREGVERKWLKGVEFEEELAPGEVSDVRYMTFPADQVQDGLLWLVVDDDGKRAVVEECSEDNNEITLVVPDCTDSD